jgi:hypothetical protein
MRGATGRWWTRRPVLALDVLVVLLVSCYFAGDLRLDRTDAVGYHPARPTDGPGQDWLLVGSERPGESRPRTPAVGRRIDAILLLHIPHAHGSPTLIGLPRTTYAPIQGHGSSTFEAAYALGGPRLLVSTVENGTGVRIDRYAEFAADSARGAPDRSERPGALVEELTGRVFRPGVLLNPLHGVPLLMDAARSITVDEADHLHHLIQLAVAMRRVGNGDAVTVTLPIGRRGSIAGVGPVALIDDARLRVLATAIARDRPLPPSLLMN